MPLFEPILAALGAAGVRYVVVGGVATVLHGHARLTADLDLAIDLTGDHPRSAIEALLGVGLVPVLPVAALDFADAESRQRWVAERNLVVFALHDPDDPLRRVDLFAEDPMPFEELWERSVELTIGPNAVRVASIEDLLAMKRAAGRPQDLLDVEALERIRSQRDGR